MLRNCIHRVQHIVSLSIPDLAILSSGRVPVQSSGSHSLKTCTERKKDTIILAASESFQSFLCPMGARIAQLPRAMRCSISEQLGSQRLTVSPTLSQAREIHGSMLLRQKGVMQRTSAWGGRAPAHGSSRPNAFGAPPRRPPNRKRRGPITERRLRPGQSFGEHNVPPSCSAALLCLHLVNVMTPSGCGTNHSTGTQTHDWPHQAVKACWSGYTCRMQQHPYVLGLPSESVRAMSPGRV